jgi:hypothetical protein
MTPIYDRDGKVIAWLKGKQIMNPDGSHIAMLVMKSVIDYAGKYLGIYDNGLFRDKEGNAVAFTPGAMNGPVLPIPATPPIPPIPALVPKLPIPPCPPIPPFPSLNWSKLTWPQFLQKE